MSDKKIEVFVGDIRLPGALQTDIIARFLKTAELKAFWESYTNVRHRANEIKPPTEEMIRLAKLRKKGKIAREIAKEEKKEVWQVQRAIQKVSMWEYLNS